MTDKLAEYQRAFLLLHLLLAKDRTLGRAEANRKLTTVARKYLNLNAGVANRLRAVLSEEGFVQILKKTAGRGAESYRLTDRGLALLGTLEQYPTASFRFKGQEINALISAVREVSDSWKEPKEPTRRPEPPTDLGAAIVAEFEELYRERHHHRGLVPIHEVREGIAARFGPDSARHDVFDPQVQRLRQAGRVRIVPISDLRSATAAQLNDSIPGVNETLFYLEPTHEQPIVR
jgi:predicted transcriptional regulator